MLKIYRIELRRSPLLTTLPVLITVDLLVLFGRSRHWIGVWPEASAAAQVVTLFLGPVLAAVAAWQAGRASRAGLPESLLAAARPGWQVEAARLAATLTLGFTAYAVGCLVAVSVSLPDAGPGFLWPSYLLVGTATLTIFAALGHLAGRWWPSAAFTPVVCALGGFVVLVGAGQSIDMFVLSGAPDQMLRAQPIVWHLLFAVALAALAILVPRPGRVLDRLPRWPQPGGRSMSVIATAACTVVALIAIPAVGNVQVDRPVSAVEPLCESVAKGASQVCVWPEHRKYLPELAAMADRVSRIPQAWLKMPSGFSEYGLNRTDLGDGGFDVAEGHVRTAAIAMSVEVFRSSFGRCRAPDPQREAWQAAKDRITLWLEYRAMGEDPSVADAGLTMSGVSEAQHDAAGMVRQPEAAQERWISQQRGILRKIECTP
ncbi:DUF7224 domain-containing protein [Streptomyces xanthochromogenes]|uniref:DUF7224 domain-containing protein n=1 Tax=Streptomyces xanthochromogenes TaxID=67384 RepID=UPI00382C6A23